MIFKYNIPMHLNEYVNQSRRTHNQNLHQDDPVSNCILDRFVTTLYNFGQALNERINNIVGKSWWSNILNTPNLKNFKANWKILAHDKIKLEETVKDIQTRYEKTTYAYQSIYGSQSEFVYDEPLGYVYGIPYTFSTWMPGIALLASYLSEKKQLKGLYVCATLPAFSHKLKEISESPANCRCAFIVPCCNPGFPIDFPQHKTTICVEKEHGRLSIALLEPIISPSNLEIDPTKLSTNLWEGNDTADGFISKELIFRAIMNACRNTPCQTRFTHSQVPREKHYGCETFALRDSIAFLRDKTFFQRIVCSKDIVHLDSRHTLEAIILLPPEYMIGTQSAKTLQAYKQQIPASLFHQRIPGKRKAKSLQQYLDQHRIVVAGKEQNHYMTKKCFKYLLFVIEALETLPKTKVQALINKSLII